MASIENRLDRARFRLKQRQVRPAVKLLRSILRDDPDHIETLDLLAQLSLSHRKFEYAQELLERAVGIWPRSARLQMNLGVAYHCLERYEEAITKFQLALSLNSRAGMIHYHLGLSKAALGRLNDAGHSFQKAILRLPEFVPARCKLAEMMVKAGTLNAAVAVYQKILEIDPKRDDVFVDLGNVLRRCDNDAAAIDCYQQALQINPRSISAHNNLGNTLRDQRRYLEAEQLMRKALEIKPKNAILHNGLGLALEKLDQFEEAIACYNRAIELDPDYSNPHYNLGGIQQEIGDFSAAEKSYQQAIKIDPEKAEAQFRLALLKLLHGDFAVAWPGYEKRWKMRESQSKERAFEQPTWDGGSLSGKTIFVYTEQGLGDSLQFVRYLKLLKDQGATVLLQCQSRLTALLSRCAGIDRIYSADQKELPEFDVQVALLSLPALLETTIDSIPNETPYLFADDEKVACWKDRLIDLNGLRVGIAWQGKPTYVRDSLRSVPLTQFADLAELPDVQLISLQKSHGRSQLEQLPHSERILNLAPELDQGPDGFEDTAAVIKNLDLVITSDTALAHLAGGLGAPTWVALSFVPEWRWQLEREDSPWYPTVRLFRQRAFGDWSSAFAAIKQALEQKA